MTIYLDELRVEQLRVGETMRRVCPSCESPERSLALTRTAAHEAKFICHRNSCGIRGVYPLNGATLPSSALPPRSTAYEGAISRLDGWVVDGIQNKYDLGCSTIERNILDAGYPWLALPIRDADGKQTATLLRWSWLEPNPPVPKTKLFLEGERRSLAWYPSKDAGCGNPSVLLVEDCLSAMRAAEYGWCPAAALLGTELGPHIAELTAAGVADIVLALDPDALETAFETAKAWGPAFRSFRVLVLESDIKDLPLTKLRTVLSSI